MNSYKPGTVAVATVRGIPNVRVWRHGVGPSISWMSAFDIDVEESGKTRLHGDCHVTDVRPLVVLDFDDIHAPTIVGMLREDAADRHDNVAYLNLADQIEAQTKPPRIPEPVEIGSLVNAEGCLWAKAEDGQWVCLGDGNSGLAKPWAFLASPALVRNGIEDGAK